MCGIAGILRVFPPGATPPEPDISIPQSWIDTLDEHVKHRGPDGFGVFRDRALRSDGATVDVALIHRRLAIIDPAHGHQPMRSQDGRVAVVFNGCIYNHAELRRELEQQGCVFQSDHSDTEVLVHGWHHAESQVFRRIEGMYACAIWDRRHADFFLSRDWHGEKPLYECMSFVPTQVTDIESSTSRRECSMHEQHGVRWFASSASACTALSFVLQSQAVISNLTAPVSVDRFLRTGSARVKWSLGHEIDAGAFELPNPRRSRESVEQEVTRAIPHIGNHKDDFIDARWLERRCSYRLRHVSQPTAVGSLDESRTESLLRQSVISRLITDVPLGCFLSGGVDSSLIAAFAQDHLRARGQRLQTFTMQMPHAAYDESPYAQAVAEHLQTEHHVLTCETNVASDLVKLIEQLGLPFGDSSLLPTYWLCKAARQHVKVALAGDGGDELFAGYDRHWAGLFLNKYGRVLRALPSADLIADNNPKSSPSRLARLVDAAKHAGYEDLVAIFPASMFATLTNTPIDEKWMKETRDRSRQSYPWQHDTLNYLPDDLLRKTDTASMAVALEVRCPFLSRELAAAAWHTPPNVLLPRGERKGLLRAVARKFIPASIIDRPKQGFAIPLGDWFRDNYGGLRDLYLDLVINASDPFPEKLLGLTINRQYVKQLTDEHMTAKRDHAQRLYLLLVFAIWSRWMNRLSQPTRTT
jgi:asparagine synthase (glutamine-hydrolysing)